MRRLPPQPGERIARDRPVAFTFDGRRVAGFEGDTIGSALAAAGRPVWERRLVVVDGRPGVSAGREPLRAGMRVEIDPAGAAGVAFAARRWWDERRRAAGGAFAARRRADERRRAAGGWQTEHRHRHTDVLVVGGGAAGLSAAIAAARAGADVVLADEGLEPGGRLLAEGGHRRAAELAARARAAGVELLGRAAAVGCVDGLVAIWQDATLHHVRARALVFATGAIEQPLVFARNDLPGIMGSGDARTLVARFGVAPGERAVVVTTGDRGLEAALALRRAGVAVAAVADLRRDPSPLAQELALPGTELRFGHTVWEARGSRGVTGAVLGPVDRVSGERTVACDALIIAGGDAPAAALAVQAGARTVYDERLGHLALRDLPDGVYAAGDIVGEGAGDAAEWSEEGSGDAARVLGAGAEDAAEWSRATTVAELSGALAGADAAHALGLGDAPSIAARERLRASAAHPPHVAVARGPAQEAGQDLATLGQAAASLPVTPVPLGVLAGRPHTPAKRSAIPGDGGDETLDVHENGGLIDVSAIGKLLVCGAHAAAFLDRLLPVRIAGLEPGHLRPSVVTDDAGRLVDEATVCRLEDDAFYVTTSAAGAGLEWFTWWLARRRMEVRITDLTEALSAVTVVGPRARDVLGELAALDCSARFGHQAHEAAVAHVPCLVMRTDDLAYELHCPAAHGEHVWDALLTAGAAHGVRRVGLEGQRILRLEKLHPLVGRDADARIVAPPWTVEPDKPDDFVGRWALEHHAGAPAETALVGFTLPEGSMPPEGAAVLDDDGGAVGRVTAARYSPRLHRVLGMAWVPSPLAVAGAPITIADGDWRYDATVRIRPGHDSAEDASRGSDRPSAAADLGGTAVSDRPSAATSRGSTRPSRAFLRVDAAAPGVVARSPLEPATRAAGARFEERDGWRVAVAYEAGDDGTAPVVWADCSPLGKLERHGAHGLAPGSARREGGTWWCPLGPERALVLCAVGDAAALRTRLDGAAATASGAGSAAGCAAAAERRAGRASGSGSPASRGAGADSRANGVRGADAVVDVTCAYAALRIAGPLARELLARLCALDLRPRVAPPGAFLPGPLARAPGMVLCEGDDRYLALVGSALGEYLWTVVEDAGRDLGGRPVAADA